MFWAARVGAAVGSRTFQSSKLIIMQHQSSSVIIIHQYSEIMRLLLLLLPRSCFQEEA